MHKITQDFFLKINAVILFVLLFFLTSGRAAEPAVLNLMPIPQKIIAAEGKFRLDETFTISISGHPDLRLYKGANRALKRLAGRTGFFFSQDYLTPEKSGSSGDLQIVCQQKGNVRLGEDEAYQLTVLPERIKLAAKTDIGALHGLETFLQLLSVDDDGYYFPAIKIEDEPRFPWRGLLIDVGRHFMPVEVIKRNLDGMAAVKMNVLHLHLTEDQGFRVECKTFPKLHELGSDGFYYTQAQVKDIIAYAADRGIRVMPEFDIPGHATSWFVGYPELASAPGPYSIERGWGIKNPTFNPTLEKTYEFLDAFFKEMAQLFPDEYMHIGGDENNGKQWNANRQIQQFMKQHNIADNHALQSYFNKRILTILTKYGKKMVGWDEIFQADMPTSIVIQSWRGKEAMIKSARKGYQTILSNGYYIDLIQPTDFHYLNDPLPPDSPLSATEKKYILGGEATMWAEFVSPETIDSRIWPRTAAIAERLWSSGTVRDVQDMYRRLDVVSFHLEELGLLHKKNYPMMLRRLTNNQDIVPLKNLVDVIEPVKQYKRNQLRKHTAFSPLTRVVDAARPDAEIARHFRKLVNDYLEGGRKDRYKEKQIKEWLVLWQDNHEDLSDIINKSPVLREIESLSQDLSDGALIGLEALKLLSERKKMNNDWLKPRLAMLERAKKPRGQTELMVVSAMEKLVKAVVE